jgi:transposase
LSALIGMGYPGGMTTRQADPTELTDKAWHLIQHLVPKAKASGRPEAYPKREILNAIF